MHPTRTRWRIAALAVAAVTTTTVLTVTPDASAQTVGEVRYGENYRQGDDPASARGRDVPGLAVNPSDPRHVVSVSVDYLNGECSFKTSFDGGVTWPHAGNFNAPVGWPDPPCFQNFDSGGYAHGNASVMFGSGQNVYTAFSSHRGPFQRPESNIIAGIGDDSLVVRSTDGGRTWATAIPAIIGGPDPQPFNIRPQVAVHRGAGANGADRVYVNAWRCRVISGGCSGGNDIREMWVSRSDDSGITWSDPVRATAPTGGPTGPNLPGTSQVNEPSQPVVDQRNGAVYMTWRRRDGSPTPTVNNVQIARSLDLGQTWERFTAGPANAGAHPRIAIDPNNGTLYVAYQDNRFATGDQDIILVRSTDRGETWSAPKRVNDDPVGNNAAQQVPRVEVAPNGRVDVVWLDRRHDPTSPTGRGVGDIYHAYSLDGGVNFSANRRVTDRPFNRDLGLTGVGGYTWYGPVMAPMGNDELLVAWTDTREGNHNNGRQDIFLAKADLRSAGLPVKRVGGASAPGLSAALAKLAYPGGVEGVGGTPVDVSRPVVVNENDAVAALAGAPLARVNWAPLLASPAARLTPDVQAEVARMEPVGAFVVGDEAALGSLVASNLTEAGVPADKVVRLTGSSPADLARNIAMAMDPRTPAQKTANTVRPFAVAVVVNPAAPESASAAALASALRVPILFSERDGVPAATHQALAALGNINATLVVGGTGAVGDAAMASLPGARRVGGGDAAAVSRAVMSEAMGRSQPANIVYVADSERAVDAALAGATVGRNLGQLLLVPGADPAAAEQVLAGMGLRSTVDRLVVARSGATGPGYRLVARDGGIFAFGDAGFFGSTGAMRLAQPVVGMATTPSTRGYWLVAGDGGVFAFGDARFRGSTGALRLAQAMVGIAPTPTGNGYWLVARDGGVFAFGDARFFGSTASTRLNQPIVGIAATPTGLGYWLVAADGGIFAFGDARFLGSTGALRLVQPVVGIAASPSGLGYRLVARDGGVFAFGDATFKGSTGALRLNQPVVAMAATRSGQGYWLTASDGGVFAFGDAGFSGSTGGMRLNQPVVGMSAVS